MNIEIEPLSPHQSRKAIHPTSFAKVFSDRMFTQEWTSDDGWKNAKIGPYREIALDPASAVLHYAQEIFEGTKAYRRPDGHINLFRPWENAARFNRSAGRMAMPQVDTEFHVEAIAELVRLEGEWVPHAEGSSLYIRPTMIATEVGLGVHSSNAFLHYIIVSPSGAYFANGMKPINVWVEQQSVRAVRGGTGAAKCGGNYAASLVVSEHAAKLGYQQVLWLDAIERKFVEEVGAMNIGFVFNGKHVSTPALTGSILPGVTRNSILKLAPDVGFTASEDRLDINDVVKAIESGEITEAFGIGTAAVIAPIGKLGFGGKEFVLNDNKPGPVAQLLYKALTDIQYGRVADPYGWTHKIEAK